MVSKTSDLILGSDLKDSELVATIALIEFFSNFSLLIALNNVARQIIKKNTELKNKTLFEKGFELFVNRNNNNTKNHNEIINISFNFQNVNVNCILKFILSVFKSFKESWNNLFLC